MNPHIMLAILAVSVALYTVRLAGLTLPERRVPPFARELLRRFPAALFAALLAAALAGAEPAANLPLLVAVALVGLITWCSGRAGLGLLIGLIVALAAPLLGT